MADKPISFYDQCLSLTECRQNNIIDNNVPAHLQRGTLRRLDKSFKLFFRRIKQNKKQKPGFPRFKGIGRYKTLEWAEYSGINGNELENGNGRMGSIGTQRNR